MPIHHFESVDESLHGLQIAKQPGQNIIWWAVSDGGRVDPLLLLLAPARLGAGQVNEKGESVLRLGGSLRTN
jgi:hypothetical protein